MRQSKTPSGDAVSAPGPPPRWAETLSLGLPMLALGGLSIYQLGALNLWRDEVASVVFAKGSLPELLTIVGRDRAAVDLANMATYYLLLHFWLGIHESDGWIRLLSVIAGMASVVPVYFIARRLLGWVGASLAATIFVLGPSVILYSREARSYALAMLVAGSLTWLLLIGVERRERWWPWLLYGLIAAAGLYVHFFVALIVVNHGLWLLATRQLPPLRSALAALVPLALAAAPIPSIILEFGLQGQGRWIQPLSVSQVTTELTGLAGGTALLLALAALSAVALTLRRTDARVWLMAGCVALPILAAIAISAVKPMFVGRYLVMVLPHATILAAVAIMAIRQPTLRAATGAGLAVLLVLAVPNAYHDHREQHWAEAAAWMEPMTEPGDRMIAGNGQRPLNYYLGRIGDAEVPQPTSSVQAIEHPAAGRLWVAMSGPEPDDRLLRELAPAFVVARQQQFGTRLRVVLMLPRAEEDG